MNKSPQKRVQIVNEQFGAANPADWNPGKDRIIQRISETISISLLAAAADVAELTAADALPESRALFNGN
ncbi:MAG: hypothetical protein AAF456_20295 [Planctomycetota bacterium]